MLGALAPPADRGGRLVVFDQREFAGGAPVAISLADSGYAWVPRGCERGGCRVHVVFHGCRQNAQSVGERFVRESGYNRWAETNRLVVLYPQTIARWGWAWGSFSFVFNPRGCWDWWGYTGPAYATKAGPQIRAVQAMLERLASPR
jgi:poly(3-hydroxybutyrate) depolymerase